MGKIEYWSLVSLLKTTRRISDIFCYQHIRIMTIFAFEYPGS